MPSFATLSLLVTLAFAGFSSAVPLPFEVGVAALPAEAKAEVARRHNLPASSVAPPASSALPSASSAVAAVPSSSAASVQASHPNVPAAGAVKVESALPAILNTASSKLAPVTAQLQHIQAANATLTAIQPVTDEVTAILNEALNAINGLVGQPLDAVLATAEGKISVPDLANLISGVLSMTFLALGKVMSVAGDAKTEVAPLLAAVGATVGNLLKLVLSLLGPLVGSLLSTVLPLLGDVTSVLGELGLTDVLSLLKL